MEYSGVVSDGWNLNGTYDRIQYAGKVTSLSEIIDVIEDGIEQFYASERSRLDLRLKYDGDKEILDVLHRKFPKMEIAGIFNPNDFSALDEIIVCLNNEVREVGIEAVMTMQQATYERIKRLLQYDVEQDGINALDTVLKNGYKFELNDFSALELHTLWADSFGWSFEQCELYAPNNRDGEKVFGLRDRDDILAAALLISHGETTEWAVSPDRQGHGLISPLLLFSHIDWKLHHSDEVLQVFARFNRSVSPGLRTGLVPYTADDNYILTNHVTVSSNEVPDMWNVEKSFIGGMDGTKLRSFVIGQLDPKLITDRLSDYYLTKIL